MTCDHVSVSHPAAGVLLVSFRRLSLKNALCTAMLQEIATILDGAEGDDAVGAVVMTGGEVFAAGADLKEMSAKSAVDALLDPRAAAWRRIAQFPKPLLAAVNGFALGGGLELAMHADIIIAGSDARLGQPEVNFGIIPGAGGTQRLTQAVGKSLAMKMVLSGEIIDSGTALRAGLVAEVVEPGRTVDRAVELAARIAGKPRLAVRLAKEAVLQASDRALAAGMAFERQAFSMLFATEDRAEGTAAFLQKRKPVFRGR
ncbi:MAG: enoyl-CoA hydratase/isomerase family protein [Geminicoccaceae bacterium]|nr:enoyl-CoA hydratase/isomerase family protein [Geminicoccaceae bacterium]